MNAQNCTYEQVKCSSPKASLHLQTYWQKISASVQRRNELARQRRQLRKMDDLFLKDTGLSRADVSRITTSNGLWEDPLKRKTDLDPRYRSNSLQREG